MTKHVHMGPNGGPSSAERPEHSNVLLSGFVFIALVFYAATNGFIGGNGALSSVAQFATKMVYRWDESVAPHVLTPLREQGLSVLHYAAPAGSGGGIVDSARKRP